MTAIITKCNGAHWLADCCNLTSWQHLRYQYQDKYRVVTVHTRDDFIVLPYWEIRPTIQFFYFNFARYVYNKLR